MRYSPRVRRLSFKTQVFREALRSLTLLWVNVSGVTLPAGLASGGAGGGGGGTARRAVASGPHAPAACPAQEEVSATPVGI